MAGEIRQIKTSDDVLHDLEVDLSDYYTKTEDDALLGAKADASAVYTKSETDLLLSGKADNSDIYTKSELNALFDSKANVNTVYTKGETDTLLSHKADAQTTYTKSETDALLLGKADSNDVYPKSDTYSRTQTDDLLNQKADNSAVYPKSDLYTKAETDALLLGKADDGDSYTKAEDDALLGAKADASDVYTISQIDGLLDAKADIDDSSTTSTSATWSADKLNVEFQNCAKNNTDNTLTGNQNINGKVVKFNQSNIDSTDTSLPNVVVGDSYARFMDKNDVCLYNAYIVQDTDGSIALNVEFDAGNNPNGKVSISGKEVLVNGLHVAPTMLYEEASPSGTIADAFATINSVINNHLSELGRMIIEINGLCLRHQGNGNWCAGAFIVNTSEYCWYVYGLSEADFRQVYTNAGTMMGGSVKNNALSSLKIYLA